MTSRQKKIIALLLLILPFLYVGLYAQSCNGCGLVGIDGSSGGGTGGGAAQDCSGVFVPPTDTTYTDTCTIVTYYILDGKCNVIPIVDRKAIVEDIEYNYEEVETDTGTWVVTIIDGVRVDSFFQEDCCIDFATGTANGEFWQVPSCAPFIHDISTNDSCDDGSIPTYQLVTNISPDSGFVFLNADGTLFYQPPNDSLNCPTGAQEFTVNIFCGSSLIGTTIDTFLPTIPVMACLENIDFVELANNNGGIGVMPNTCGDDWSTQTSTTCTRPSNYKFRYSIDGGGFVNVAADANDQYWANTTATTTGTTACTSLGSPSGYYTDGDAPVLTENGPYCYNNAGFEMPAIGASVYDTDGNGNELHWSAAYYETTLPAGSGATLEGFYENYHVITGLQGVFRSETRTYTISPCGQVCFKYSLFENVRNGIDGIESAVVTVYQGGDVVVDNPTGTGTQYQGSTDYVSASVSGGTAVSTTNIGPQSSGNPNTTTTYGEDICFTATTEGIYTIEVITDPSDPADGGPIERFVHIIQIYVY